MAVGLPTVLSAPSRVNRVPGDGDASREEGRVIRFQGVSVLFGDVVALRGLDLSFEAEAISVLIGPSGCGKSSSVSGRRLCC